MALQPLITIVLFCINMIFVIAITVIAYLNRQKEKRERESAQKTDELAIKLSSLIEKFTWLESQHINHEKMKETIKDYIQPITDRIVSIEKKQAENSDVIQHFTEKQSVIEIELARIQEGQKHTNLMLKEIKEALRNK